MTTSGPQSGFQEIVLSVWDIEKTSKLIESVFQYELKSEGQIDRQILKSWGLADNCTATERVYGHTNISTNYLRIVQFHGVDQQLIRSNSQSWDTGGIYNMDIRAIDYDARIEELNRAGFLGFSDSKRYQFGPFDVSEVLLKGHEDIVLAVMKRYAPPLEGYPHLTHMSEPFNSSQIVRDYDKAKAFYIDVLGWKMHSEYMLEGTEDQDNLFGMPQNLYRTVKRKIGILEPQGENYGSTEIIELEGAEGRDFADRAVAPNLGYLMYRYKVKDIVTYHQEVSDASPSDIIELNIMPYGLVKLFHVRTPDGVWIEFYQ